MKRLILTLAVACMTVTACRAHVVAAEVSANMKTVVPGNTAFAVDLYGKLKGTEGNLFFSPYSISTALAMTYGGARENTAKQMAQTLHFSLAAEKLHPAFSSMEARLNAVQKKGNVKLSVANSLWPQKDYPFLKEYLDLTKKYYGVTITPVDFVTAAEPARLQINTWVEDKTQKKIKDLIQKGVLDAMTRLVLVNAIYFKGNWARQFRKDNTQDAPFNVSPGKTVQVPLMTQEENFGYAETEDLQILELLYAGNDLSMVVLLPKKADGLADVEKALTAENLAKRIQGLHQRNTLVFLPKFKMTSQFELSATLKSLGMTDAFDAAADFSGMDGKKGWLFISDVIHKAFVDVNEEGTEAAAATAVIMRATAMPSAPPTFRADHPFIFLIRDNQTGSILFLGRVMDPSKG